MNDVNNLIGLEINNWKLIKVIGKGADAVVYLGQQGSQSRAIKIFFPDILKKNGFEEGLQRLELQLNLKGKEKHPNLVEIYEGDELPEYQTIYLMMEYIDGSSLDTLIGKIPPKSIQNLVQQLAKVVSYLESLDLVHRDIKPANIMISDDFSHLTLLDLGVVLQTGEVDERLSGEEFVSTTRYSPPEFVWRTEESSDEQAWRAISFYQIGATIHDVIMGYPIFSGNDKPRSHLYDAVKYLPPNVESSACEPWIVNLVRCCLVKNWRERITLVSWDHFNGPSQDAVDVEMQLTLIRLRQIRHEELKILKALKSSGPTESRTHQLWDLNSKVFMETRQFLMIANIFPRCSASQEDFGSKFEFEVDPNLMFLEKIVIDLVFSVDSNFEISTQLHMVAKYESGDVVFEGKWIEMLSVETATKIVQQSLLDIANKVVPLA